MTPHGLIANVVSGVNISHNPNYDLHVLIGWVSQKGVIFDSEFRHNMFGEYHKQIKLKLAAALLDNTVVRESTPFIRQTIPSAILTGHVCKGCPVIDYDNVDWIPDYLKNSVRFRTSMISPQECINALSNLNHIVPYNVQSVKNSVAMFNFKSYLDWMVTQSRDLLSKKPVLKEIVALLNRSFTHTDQQKIAMYARMSEDLFATMESLFDLVNNIIYSSSYLDMIANSTPAASLSTYRDLLGGICYAWDEGEVTDWLVLLGSLGDQWKGMNYMSITPASTSLDRREAPWRVCFR